MLKQFISKLNRKGFFHLLSSNFLIQFLGFGLIIFLGKILPASDIGIIKTVQSFTAFFIVIATFGYNTSLLKLASEKRSISEKRALLILSLKKVLIFSIISTTILWVMLYFNLLSKNEEVKFWLYRYSTVIVFAALGYIFFAYFQALKKIKKVAKLQAIIRIVFIILILISAYYYGLNGLIYSSILSYIIGTLIYIYNVKYFKLKTNSIKNINNYNNYAKYSFLATLIGVFSQNVDIYLLDYFKANKDLIGFYSISLIFFLSATVINGTVQSIITPYFSYNEKNFKWLRNTLIKYQLLMIPASFVISLCLYIAAYCLVNYYYGIKYIVVLDILPLLLVKYLIWSLYSITGGALVGLGIIKITFYLSSGITFLGLVLSYNLYFEYGINGIIYGGIISNILSFFVATFLFFNYINKRMNIEK